MKFHLKYDKPMECEAKTPESCPYDSMDHASSRLEARRIFERQNEHNLFNFGVRSSTAAKVRRFVAVAGVLASAFSVAACGTLDTDKQTDWKAYEQQQADKSRQEAKERAGKVYDDAKDYSQKKWDQAKEKAKGLTDGSGDNDGSQSSESGSSSSDNGSAGANSDGDDIFFQGKPLKPTAEEVATAKEQLASLTVAPENDASDYNRKEMFGGWDDGTVSAVEMRDIPNGTFDDNGRAEDGSAFVDPYTGKVVTIVKGSSHDADVDHLVPLKEVYRSEKNGMRLTVYQRHQIANDLDNLQLVGSKENRSKSDKDPATYIPSYEPSQCQYVVSYVKVKYKYKENLTVDQKERDAIMRTLDSKCG